MITIISLLALIILLSTALPYDNFNIIRLYKKLSYKQKALLVCFIGWAVFIVLNTFIAVSIVQILFGPVISGTYSFFSGAAIGIFWYIMYPKIQKNLNTQNKS